MTFKADNSGNTPEFLSSGTVTIVNTDSALDNSNSNLSLDLSPIVTDKSSVNATIGAYTHYNANSNANFSTGFVSANALDISPIVIDKSSATIQFNTGFVSANAPASGVNVIGRLCDVNFFTPTLVFNIYSDDVIINDNIIVGVQNHTLIINGLHNLGEAHVIGGPLNVQIESLGQNFVIGEGNLAVQLIAQSPELWHAMDRAQQERLLKVLLEPKKDEGVEFAARLHMMMDLMKITIEDVMLDPYNLLLRPAIFSTLSNDELSNIQETYNTLNDNVPTGFTTELLDLVASMLVGIEPELFSVLQFPFAGASVENEVQLIGYENSEYAEDQKEDI